MCFMGGFYVSQKNEFRLMDGVVPAGNRNVQPDV